MSDDLTSRERMLLTFEHKKTDYIPCSFMMFHGLRDRYPGDQLRFIEEQQKLGLDAVVELPELPLTFHNDVSEKTWKEVDVPGEQYPLLHKEYCTPAGTLHMSIRKTEDWPYGDKVNFYDDYNVSRSINYHVNGRTDLKSLRYLLMPPTGKQIRDFLEECKKLQEIARQKGLLIRGVRGVMIDAAIRFAGVTNLVFAAMEDPEYVEEFLDIIGNWNMQRMEIVLDRKPDLFLRRAWYENMSFWSPDLFRKFMKPYLKEVKWAHQAGVKFGYINTCCYMSLLEEFLDIGIDVLVGADPVQDRELDMALLKRKVGSSICLWGGGNGFVTIERSKTEAEIRDQVYAAMEILAPEGGFILSPVDNVRSTSEAVLQNVLVFIDAWKEKRRGGYFGQI